MNRWKRIAGFCLAAFLLFSAASADRAYTPGETAKKLLADHLPEGTLLGSAFSFSLKTGDRLPEGVSAESAAALSRLLSGLEVYLALGRTAEGPRLEWAARYAGENGKEALFDFSLTANRERFSLESSLIGDKRFAARWDTLLSRAGLTEEGSAAPLPADNPDFSPAALREAAEHLLPLLAPYAACFREWRSSLTEVTQTDLPAEGIFPAAAKETEIQISEAEAADLLSAVADLLAKDENLPVFWAESGLSAYAEYPGAELAAALRDLAQSLREDSEPSLLLFTVAQGENAEPLYWIAEEKILDTDDYNGAALVLGYDAEHDARLVRVSVGSRKDGETRSPLDFTLSWHRDADNARVFALTLDGTSETDSASVSFEGEYSQSALADDRGPYGYEFTAYEDAVVLEGGVQQEGAEYLTLQYYLTDAGGEEAALQGRFAVLEGETVRHQADCEANLFIEPGADGFTAGADFFLTLESLGIAELNISADARPVALNPVVPQLKTVSLEDGGDDVSALLTEAAQGALSLSADFLSALPEEDRMPLLRLFSPETPADPAETTED